MKYDELMKIITTRRSVRSFIQDYEVSEDIVKKILEAARHIPSARNIQPLEFIVVRDKEILKGMSAICQQNQNEQVSVSIVLLGDIPLARRVGKISSHTATTAEKGENLFMIMDASAAIQNMCLAARSLEIDTVWISSYKEKELSELLNLPDTYVPLAILPLGKRKNEPFSPPKRPLKERTHTDIFQRIDQDFAYLELSKKINETSGELKNYSEFNYSDALKLFDECVNNSEFIQNKTNFKNYALAISTKCHNLSLLLKKTHLLNINEEEMKSLGMFHNIGECFTNDERLYEVESINFLNSNNLARMANIVGSQVVGIGKLMKFARKKIENTSHYSIDSIEKEILTYSILTIDLEGNDISYIEKIKDLQDEYNDEKIKIMVEDNKDALIAICEKLEYKINQ